jgi:hypothetical protein
MDSEGASVVSGGALGSLPPLAHHRRDDRILVVGQQEHHDRQQCRRQRIGASRLVVRLRQLCFDSASNNSWRIFLKKNHALNRLSIPNFKAIAVF